MLTTVLHAATKAGREISKIYRSEIGVEYKADLSPITKADRKGHAIIVDYLKRNTDIPILSEEGANIPYETRADWSEYWLIDPLDGTKEFINRNGEFTVNIALIRGGLPVLGVVYAPVKQWLYIGIEGEGAWRLELENHQLPADWNSVGNKLPLQHSNKGKYTIVGSRSHASKETDEYITKLEALHTNLDFISMGSSLKICLVAEGKADLYPRLAPTMEWDTAAGDAIARAAGCKVIQYGTGEPLRYNKENLLNPWFIVQR
ncbi:3'(2'),5'-bisphosphate nucleotidase CysQ [Pontibacter flavimaris]|uniref:3'(2'),5'-bisphosphate nucleotidase CysQ n=1 Tax=Pontibacter flavimaris TaxID=1797110 RepID=A0A1Q5PCB6_9BACT|nr:3'(2'),5'-bisphosphate nucleotidase CysQ [Pontibacter flavimaris]OKL39878.1 3'(2'),5'-bisphosphate nucleotidase CysQ [Pontibacter flavimaris]